MIQLVPDKQKLVTEYVLCYTGFTQFRAQLLYKKVRNENVIVSRGLENNTRANMRKNAIDILAGQLSTKMFFSSIFKKE